MLKVILFDWDGTCHNSIINIEKAYYETQEILGLECPWEEFRFKVGRPTLIQAQEVYPKDPQKYVETYRHCYCKLVEGPLYNGTKETLERLKENFTLCLVTSKSRSAAIASMNNMGIPNIFDHIICGDDVNKPKPHPEPVIKGLEYYNIKPEEAIYIGDSAHDINASKGAGVPVIGVTWGILHKDEIESEKPDYVADTWDDVIGICESLL